MEVYKFTWKQSKDFVVVTWETKKGISDFLARILVASSPGVIPCSFHICCLMQLQHSTPKLILPHRERGTKMKNFAARLTSSRAQRKEEERERMEQQEKQLMQQHQKKLQQQQQQQQKQQQPQPQQSEDHKHKHAKDKKQVS